MNGYQSTFERHEKKYLLDEAQYQTLRLALADRMQADEYGLHTIYSLYYDTPDYRLIRTSLRRPTYKEKLRLRSYGVPGREDTVYVELKKKYRGVVYKRRVGMPLWQAREWLAGQGRPENFGQIHREIDYFLAFYQPQPAVLLAYDRIALAGREDPALRITFDRAIRWRTQPIDLGCRAPFSPLPMQGDYLMEVKVPGAFPVWMSRLLSTHDIFPTSFSKYGSWYARCLVPQGYRAMKGDDLSA